MARCHDCGVEEGMLHRRGCDMERCPFCGRQLISCDCVYEKLGIDVSPGTWAYQYGLTPVQDRKWTAMLNKKGRIPWVEIPWVCAKCGKIWPKMFMDPEWEKYVPPNLQPSILCLPCYNKLKELFPRGWKNA